MDNCLESNIQILLTRSSSSETWGFRLQGGSDFPTPLSVQSVAEYGIAQKAGLVAGDVIVKINDKPSTDLEHEEAKRTILACGNRVLLTILREGGPIWKPSVTLIADEEGHSQINKFSLAANKQEINPVGSKFNITPKPFSANICTREQPNQSFQETHLTDSRGSSTAMFRSVRAPTACSNVISKGPSQRPVCHLCGKDIIGVFPMVSGHPIHPECFSCHTCGKNLKNQGYYFTDGSLYCDEHAV